MATFYLDYEGGNDANDGTTFANRWKTITNGATAARIAPGDTIRIMASPDPTSIGNATWTGGGRPLAINIASSTNATPIEITTSAAHGLSANDYVSVIDHTTNTNANGIWKVGAINSTTKFTIVQIDGTNTTGNGVGGATGNITKVNNTIVKTASALVQNIALCGGLGQKPAWTQSANVTATQLVTTYKEGYSCASIAIGAAFTTGKAAYYTLPASLDLSAYQQVSFWIRLVSGTIGAAGSVYVALCTDTTGDTVAHQCDVPALGTTGQWVPVTVNLGTNLNAAIQSVAFYVVTDNGAQTFYLDNIIACKAAASNDSLTLTSLISKSDGTGDEAWYAVQSLNSDAIMLSNTTPQASTSSDVRGYNGATATVTTYKRETIKTIPVASGNVQAVNEGGSAGSLTTYSGGWNRTDMSTQTGQTWFDGQNNAGIGLNASTFGYMAFDRVNFCRYNTGYSDAAGPNSIGSMYATACSTGITIGSTIAPAIGSAATALWGNNNSTGIVFSGFGSNITAVKTTENCTSVGFGFSGAGQCRVVNAITGNAGSSTGGGLRVTNSSNCTVDSVTSTNGLIGISVGTASNCFINGGSTTGSLTNGVAFTSTGELYLNNFTINETTEVSGLASGLRYLYSNRHDNTDNNSWIWQGQGTINQQAAVVDSPATTSWKMNPTTADATATSPLLLKLGTVVCAASTLVTVTARMRRSNTGLTMRLCCPGGQISGVANDVTADMTAAIDTWETVTITFTPSKAGAVDIYAYAFGGTTYSGYVCNLTASQA